MFKKTFLILISAMMILGGGGCGINSNDIAKEQEREQELFNEWLKEFLEEQELPNDYSKLSDGQQYSVKRIYEMIMYLENKYGVTFEYTGYVRPQILENEHLTAIPKGGNEKTDTVTVTCEDDGTFTDDYPNVAVRPYYEQMVIDYVESYFDSDKIRVFSTVTKTSITDFNNISMEKMNGNLFCKNIIFISNDIASKDFIKTFANNYCLWLEENGISCDSQIMLLYNPDITEIERANYSNYFSKSNIEIRLICNVENNGEVDIHELELR